MSGFVVTGSGRGVIRGGFGISIDTSELDAMAARLASAGPRIGAVASAALRKGAFVIQAAAQSNAAVDTGALRQSISTSFSGDGRSGSMAAEIGPTVDYGKFVEEGTSRMAPQPYLGPAADRGIPQIEAALGAVAQVIV